MENADLQDKSAVFARLEEAIAFERACSSIALLASLMTQNAWAKELNFNWRSSGSMSVPKLSISPLARSDDADLQRNNLTLASVIEFGIIAGKLADGTISPSDLSGLSQFADAARGALILGSRKEGFNAATAGDFKTKLMLCEGELSQALAWADKLRPSWVPKGDLANSWTKKVSKFSTPKALAEALGFPAIAAELERRELGAAVSVNPEAEGDQPRGPRML